jgi:hypothetical protein
MMNIYLSIVHSIFCNPLNDQGKYNNCFTASSVALYAWKPSLLSSVAKLLIFPQCIATFVATNNTVHGISASYLNRIQVWN